MKMTDFNMESQTFNANNIADDDSGLGMDFEEYIEESSFSQAEFSFEMTLHSNGIKREREESMESSEDVSNQKRQRTTDSRKLLMKSLSFGNAPRFLEEDVFTTVNRALDRDDLIADGSSYYRLPTMRGKHADLKSITSETMRNLLVGKYDGIISSFGVIDCRYPFEYDGGHLQGALNLHTQDMIFEFLNMKTENKPQILIFHCEFSSERGPKLCRFLRNADRRMNGDRYPNVFYPEIYLLHGGYKEFYTNCKELCFPRNYVPMLHEDYTVQVRNFRSKTRSWSMCDAERRRCPQRLF